MSITAQRRMTLEEYLLYDDGTDARFELVDGVLVEMGAECTINTKIAMMLVFALADCGVDRDLIAMKQKIEVSSSYVSARDPDLIVHTEASDLAIDGLSEACLRLNDPNPAIVIEIVSTGDQSSQNYQRDYEQKPVEYADRGIPEMWIIDPERSVVRIGSLVCGQYEFQDFRNEEIVISTTLPALDLTATQMLRRGR